MSFITISDGRVLPAKITDYEKARKESSKPKSPIGAVCHAPFVNLDFNPRGFVALCNHIFSSVAQITPDTGVLEIWRGEKMRELRQSFSRYCVDPGCIHCIHQIETGHHRETFAQEHFDVHPVHVDEPQYPQRLIFRLNSTCNLACIMCDGDTSSRVRAERDKLPAYKSSYGEPFFRDMEEILPHVEQVEFYGGEPFLVAEHLRIMEIMLRLGCKARIFVNTNTVAFSNNAKKYVEKLNFSAVAVSMDALHADVHAAVRIGMDHAKFMENLNWLMAVGARRNFNVYLNVTEHRKNWFDLPNLFRYADENNLSIHVNHCISPDNVTLYNLPNDELEYVLEFWQAQYDEMYGSRSKLNKSKFEYLMSLSSGELKRRNSGWQPFANWSNQMSDGALATPIVGNAPFDQPARVIAEVKRIQKLNRVRSQSLLGEMEAGILAQTENAPGDGGWRQALAVCRAARA